MFHSGLPFQVLQFEFQPEGNFKQQFRFEAKGKSKYNFTEKMCWRISLDKLIVSLYHI